MKIIKYLFLFSVIFASCQKEESFELPKEENIVTMSINGNDWKAELTNAEYKNQFLTISAATRDGRSIVFLILNPKVGTFYSNASAEVEASVMYNDPVTYPNASFVIMHDIDDGPEGRVPVLEITEINFETGVMSCNFSFELGLISTDPDAEFATVNITDGKIINLKFSDSNSNPNPAIGTGSWSFNNANHTGTSALEIVTQLGVKMAAVSIANSNASEAVTFTINIDENGQLEASPIAAVIQPATQTSYMGTVNLTDVSFDENAKKIKFKFAGDLQKTGETEIKAVSGEINIGY